MPFLNCAILETSAATVWCDPRIPEAARRRIATDPGRFIRAAAALPVKISPETLVLRTELPLDGESFSVIFKQYRPQSFGKTLAARFRQSKAEQNWAKAVLIRARDIATPRPLLACRPHGWQACGRSFLVSERIVGENLHLFAWRIAKQPESARLRTAAACADQLGRLIGRMHATGAAHRDLKAANFLVADREGPLQVWLVDLDGLQIDCRTNLERKARDLARLAVGLAAHPWVTRSICRRFLRAYASQFPRETIAWKPLWRMITARAAKIIQRKQRRGVEVL